MRLKRHLRQSWARLISDILSPPVIWAFLAFPIALREAETTQQALLWAVTYGVFVCLLPVAYIAWMVSRGKITDIHMQVRRQRILPFMFSIVSTAIAWQMLRLMGAPSLLPLFALFSLIQIVIMLAVTLVWQISIHSMSITCAVLTAGALYGVVPALILSPLIPVVGAARIKLRRHTLAQVIAGSVVGGILTFGMFLTLN